MSQLLHGVHDNLGCHQISDDEAITVDGRSQDDFLSGAVGAVTGEAVRLRGLLMLLSDPQPFNRVNPRSAPNQLNYLYL